MRSRSVIKVLCSLLLLLSTWSSYGATGNVSVTSAVHQIKHDKERTEHLLSKALSLFDQALIPEVVAGPAAAHVFRASDIFLSAHSAHTVIGQSTFLPYHSYYQYGQHALVTAAPPLFLSTRRLLI